jgi:enhancer of mRNA-decapping protein 3
MASEFIGYTILVTLKGPPSQQLKGIVADVVQQQLVLKDGKGSRQCDALTDIIQ